MRDECVGYELMYRLMKQSQFITRVLIAHAAELTFSHDIPLDNTGDIVTEEL